MLIAPRAYGVGRVGRGLGGRGRRLAAVSTFKSQKALLKIYILITGLWKCNYAPLYLHSVRIWKVLNFCMQFKLTCYRTADGQ
jgi:hypothetical protein